MGIVVQDNVQTGNATCFETVGASLPDIHPIECRQYEPHRLDEMKLRGIVHHPASSHFVRECGETHSMAISGTLSLP
jgi:hypothetical protein